MDKFNALVDALIGREGGYSDNPADKGGPTCWGITEQVARAFGYAGDMRSLPRDMAVSIYRRQYWTSPRFDQVADRYPALAAELFDIGVNMGVGVGVTFLQRCLNALNGQGHLYGDLPVDGAIGPVTVLALDMFRERRGDPGGEILLLAIRTLRGARYIEITEQRPLNEAFIYGWFARMVAMAKGGAA